MGRKSNSIIGSTLNGWHVLDKSSYAGTSNQRIILKCLACGTLKHTWTSNLKQDKVKCPSCTLPTRRSSLLHQLFEQGVVVAYHGSHMEIYLQGEALPENAMLYEMKSERVLSPLVPKVTGTPEPDLGYVAHAKVPAKYVDYFAFPDQDPELTEQEQEEATALWKTLVHEPPKVYATVHQGSQTKWVEEDGIQYAYLYWKDTKTWPLDQPPKAKAEPVAKALAPKPASKPVEASPEASLEASPEASPDQELLECQRIAAIPAHQRSWEDGTFLANASAKRKAVEAQAILAKQKAEWAAEDEALKRRKG